MPRKQLPIRQRHLPACIRPRDCACPWSFRARLPDGSQPRVTRGTLAEAEQAYHELMARRPEPLADRTTTIAEWAERWQASADWRPWTRKGTGYSVANHIVPGVGHFLVTELRRDDVRLWAGRMREAGVGEAAQRKAIGLLRAMYGAWLKDDRVLPRGIPVDRGLAKAPPRKEFTPLTAGQVADLAAAMPPDMALLVEMQAFYGTRMSEILALREDDITFTGRDPAAPLAVELGRVAAMPADRYRARKPQLRFARKLEEDRTAGPIKNARGNRTLPLPVWLAASLAAHLQAWPPAGGWLFTNPRTAAIPHSRWGPSPVRWAPAERLPYRYGVYLTHFAKAAASAGITLPPNQRTHSLRHHAVSVLRDAGKSDQDIGYWIGDTAQTVGQHYGRPTLGAMDRIADGLTAAREEGNGRRLRAVD